ncbi:MAG TPA: outer membrane protein assembly factor BamA [Saprospiraceae bacterium]|nr:outer membrane protein assembly factor BamA [Saprospiraceae bacterium]
MKILKYSTYIFLSLSFFLLPQRALFAQKTTVEYGQVEELEIGGIEVTGIFFSDPTAIKSVAGLKVGQIIKIPGTDITKAMRNLWKLRLFDDVKITQDKRIGNIVFLSIHLMERARLANWSYRGVKKGTHDDLNDVIKPFLIKGQVAGTAMQINARNAIQKYFIEKGYLDVAVIVSEEPVSDRTNAVNLIFEIDTKDKIKIGHVTFAGNKEVKDKKLRKLMKKTKAKAALLKKSKYVDTDFEIDKEAIVDYYHTLGFRDASIVHDTIWRGTDGDLEIAMTIDEGDKYYFGNITWKGNTIHDDDALTRVLGIRNGEVYNEKLLETRLRFSIDGRDVSSIYLDDGYLFFTVEPTEIAVRNDTIDLEMRIFEGPQATIDEVVIKGNTRTHEHVIRRELRTQPGQKFSRSDIIRSQRQIIALGYFNPEKLGIETPVDQTNGTVDIIYEVEERPSDQLELSAGWGGFGRSKVIGTLGVTFNNFSLRNIFNKDAWSPLPQGDGQRLSIRAQTNGDFFQSYNFSFTEPWLGGKRPNSFTLGGVLTKFNQEYFMGGRLAIGRAFVGIGSRLKWPDDNFVSNTTLNLEYLNLDNYATGDFVDPKGVLIENGFFNNFSIQQTIARTTINEPTFPRSGSSISLSLQATLPYTALGRKYNPNDPQSTYRFVEYHKWRLDAEWYTPIVGKLTLKTAAKMGYLGSYNKKIGPPPFERFEVGGDGLSNQQFGITGKDILAMRGYEVVDIAANASGGATVFNKFTAEIRYPLSLNPSSTIFALMFLEGGNAWKKFEDYNPFDLKRSAGVGVRAYLPMFGLLGFDFGYGWDNERLINSGAKWSQFGNFNIILGFEPD